MKPHSAGLCCKMAIGYYYVTTREMTTPYFGVAELTLAPGTVLSTSLSPCHNTWCLALFRGVI